MHFLKSINGSFEGRHTQSHAHTDTETILRNQVQWVDLVCKQSNKLCAHDICSHINKWWLVQGFGM